MKVTVIIMPEEDGGFSIVVPALPGCVSQGDDLEDALANIREAADLWLEVQREEGRPAPEESLEIISQEIERCLRGRAEDGLPPTLETRQLDVGVGVAA